MYVPIDTILVPQGIEYRAVALGVKQTDACRPRIVPIPVGPVALGRYLEKWSQEFSPFHPPRQVVLMGLCGGLTPNCAVGDVVIYQGCRDGTGCLSPAWRSCDLALSAYLQHKLQGWGNSGQALTSDRLIHSAIEKRDLGQQFGANVVDMEGYAALEVLQQLGWAVAMVRVVSDDCHQNLPDLSPAFHDDGRLRPLPLAVGMVRQPMAAARLIRGSLQGLRVLRQVATVLTTQESSA